MVSSLNVHIVTPLRGNGITPLNVHSVTPPYRELAIPPNVHDSTLPYMECMGGTSTTLLKGIASLPFIRIVVLPYHGMPRKE